MADLREMPEAELRGRVRKLLAEVHPERTDSITFRRKQFEHGLAWVHFPEGHGGLGISPKQQGTVLDEIQKHSKVVHHDPPVSTIGTSQSKTSRAVLTRLAAGGGSAYTTITSTPAVFSRCVCAVTSH